MKKKCDYCGAFMNDTDRFCAVCGGPAEPTAKAANEPATIEELQQWYADHKLPAMRVTRFFIGQSVTEKACCGIYREANGMTVLYSIDSKGMKNIAYRGNDEAYAVKEMLLKLKNVMIRNGYRV